MALGRINCDYERWQMDVKALSHYFCLSVFFFAGVCCAIVEITGPREV